jgi:hypothetical protein
MMKTVLAAMVAVALSGCAAGSESTDSSASAPPPVAKSVASLAGAWRVAGIDGADLNEPYGLALGADGQAIWFEPRCARQERLYAIEGGSIRFSVNPELQPGPGKPGVPVCMIGLPPRLGDVLRALDAAERIERSSSNAIEITGPGHSLTLYSQ